MNEGFGVWKSIDFFFYTKIKVMKNYIEEVKGHLFLLLILFSKLIQKTCIKSKKTKNTNIIYFEKTNQDFIKNIYYHDTCVLFNDVSVQETIFDGSESSLFEEVEHRRGFGCSRVEDKEH
jgi:hypothetical protein